MKTLSFSFKSSLGKTTSIRLNKYEADVTADQAKQFAQIVADAKAFGQGWRQPVCDSDRRQDDRDTGY